MIRYSLLFPEVNPPFSPLIYSQIKVLLSILPAGQPSAQPLVDFGKQSGNSVTWLVNLPVGEILECINIPNTEFTLQGLVAS